ncbi:MAG TPA: hypothetical protein VGI39_31410 [Polyangiaceae bacterium]|jgi:hypothetical protein
MNTLASLKASLHHSAADFARGRAAQPRLAPFADPGALLEQLAPSSPATHAQRDAVTLALIAEHQRTSRTLWSALLLVAFAPMLKRITRRLYDQRDAEERVLLAFLEAARKISVQRPPSHLALHLRRATERGAFGSTAAAREEPDLEPLESAEDEPAEDTEELLERRDRARAVDRVLGAEFGPDAELVFDILVHARTGRASLEAFIAERHPEAYAAEQSALYERWHRLRRRALAVLDAAFAPPNRPDAPAEESEPSAHRGTSASFASSPLEPGVRSLFISSNRQCPKRKSESEPGERHVPSQVESRFLERH